MVYVLAFFVGCGSKLIFRIFVMFFYLHFYWYSWVSGLITDGGAEAMGESHQAAFAPLH